MANRISALAPLIALLGGIFGILGAAITELTRGGFLIAFVGAPMIEEALKPSGVYLLLAKWPGVLRDRSHAAALAAFGGFAFAVVENLVYLNIYFPDHTPALTLWRYTACVGMHMFASLIFGFGIDYRLIASVNGQRKFMSTGKRFFFSAMALHSLFNIMATVLGPRLGLDE